MSPPTQPTNQKTPPYPSPPVPYPVQCPPRCLWLTSFDSQSSTHKVEVIKGLQYYTEWFQKNEYRKIKSVFITFKLIPFFPSISHFDEVLNSFPKKKKSE
jgi:hypothetical protein